MRGQDGIILPFPLFRGVRLGQIILSDLVWGNETRLKRISQIRFVVWSKEFFSGENEE